MEIVPSNITFYRDQTQSTAAML